MHGATIKVASLLVGTPFQALLQSVYICGESYGLLVQCSRLSVCRLGTV